MATHRVWAAQPFDVALDLVIWHSAGANSAMYGSLRSGVSRRAFTDSDLEQLGEQRDDEHDEHALAAALYAGSHLSRVAIGKSNEATGHSHGSAGPLNRLHDPVTHGIAACLWCAAAPSAENVTADDRQNAVQFRTSLVFRTRCSSASSRAVGGS
jgi:hypothetical protein